MNASILHAVLMSGAPALTGQPDGSHRASAATGATGATDAALPLLAEARACGWFESSWELQQGLAVSDLPDADDGLTALWFPAWRGAAAVAAVVAGASRRQ